MRSLPLPFGFLDDSECGDTKCRFVQRDGRVAEFVSELRRGGRECDFIETGRAVM